MHKPHRHLAPNMLRVYPHITDRLHVQTKKLQHLKTFQTRHMAIQSTTAIIISKLLLILAILSTKIALILHIFIIPIP